jgi:D-galactarolactone cycloisomerase
MSKIVAMASAANLPVIPHVWGTNVGLAASLQFFATLPHFPERRFPAEPFFEYDRSANPLRNGVTAEQFSMQDGYLPIPDRPGLGVTLDLDFVHEHAR